MIYESSIHYCRLKKIFPNLKITNISEFRIVRMFFYKHKESHAYGFIYKGRAIKSRIAVLNSDEK